MTFNREWSVCGFSMLIAFLLISTDTYGQKNVVFEVDRWERSKEAITLSDLTKVTPNSALTTDVRRKHHWKVLEYETRDGLKGNSISSGPLTAAPKVSLKLNVKGWYAIYVGLGGFGRFMTGRSNEVSSSSQMIVHISIEDTQGRGMILTRFSSRWEPYRTGILRSHRCECRSGNGRSNRT